MKIGETKKPGSPAGIIFSSKVFIIPRIEYTAISLYNLNLNFKPRQLLR